MWDNNGQHGSKLVNIDPNRTKWVKIGPKGVQLGPAWIFYFFLSPSRAKFGNPTSFRAQAKLGSDIPNPCEPDLS